MKRIAIIGATGMLGKPVTYEFVSRGFAVTALVRDPDAARKVLPPDVVLIKGDVQSTDDIARLLEKNDALYLSLNLKQAEKPADFHTEDQGLQNVLKVAKEVNVKRIGFLSSLVMNYQGMNGFDWWVFRIKHKAVKLIKESGIAYTIFYPSTFMDNFRYTYRRGKRILLAGTSHHKMYFIAAEDFARQVVRSYEVLTIENREYAIQGVDAYTAEEAALIYTRHCTKEKLSIAKAPLGVLKLLGNFSQTISYGSHIVEALNNYPEKFEAENTWKELGKPTISLQTFAQQKID